MINNAGVEVSLRLEYKRLACGDSLDQNQVRLSESCPGTRTFIPHMPVTMFIGKTIVPSTVSFPKTSAVCSWRSFMRMLI